MNVMRVNLDIKIESKKHKELLKKNKEFKNNFYNCLVCEALFPGTISNKNLEIPEICDICGTRIEEVYKLKEEKSE